ncbi:GTP-binding protein [Acinetobacter sp. V91_7]|uniref:GTP-binding protein n=1 Tax=unclassified Acinetobacter TaxID=196816 RepID=UPI00287D90E9|nr:MULTISPECIES: GTP-binding protein [unclassified Acinetobacter]MDS7933847.1 GTP-binding protein [Acinetobacter sp. V91_4B]MDS7962817.1 GTP-binding protein [Acinetobacter sp. V91_7]MDS8029280.1 GTP-binding protein [Acinetobacter sp. V91_13]
MTAISLKSEFELNSSRIPVTVLSGFLGSGKTTLLNYILNHQQNMKVAVIVNDMSEINIDVEDVRRHVDLSRGTDELIEMSNGCICCTLRADLLEQISTIARKSQFDYILIESTGISEPMPVAETFAFLDQNGFSLSELARLDTLVTVVNGENFAQMIQSNDKVETAHQEEELSTTRPLSDLLIEQVEYANVILVSRVDVIGQEQFYQLRSLLNELNPAAEILPMAFGEIDLEKVLNTHKFNLPDLVKSPGWMKQMDPNESIHSESENYGISSWVYHERLPFHPHRFQSFLQQAWNNGALLRCKGYIWFANSYQDIAMLVQTGNQFAWEYVGKWWNFINQADWPQDAYRRNSIFEKWDEHTGDCRQEIVFIGQNIDSEQLQQQLDQCLLTLDEIEDGPDVWTNY